MASEPVPVQENIRFGDFELDLRLRELRRGERPVKLERIPVELLLLLVAERGRIVTREQIGEHIWGKGVFLDTDNSINGAIRKIRLALKDNPERPRFVQTISGKGYRFIAPLVEGGAAQPPAVVVVRPPAAQAARTRRTIPAWKMAITLGLVLLAAVGVYWKFRPHTQAAAPTPRLMLAVLPFENLTGDPGQEYFSDGLTEELITQFGQADPRHLGVIARTSVMHYKGSREALTQVGKELGVQYVLEGSVRRDADKVRITAQLIQVRDQSHLWAREYDRELSHLLVLQSEIAQEVADEINSVLAGKRTRLPGSGGTAASTQSYDAYDLYLKGRYFWNKRTPDGFRAALQCFQQAIGKDPGYARAYAGVADSYAMMSSYYVAPHNELMPKARAAALKALALDDGLAEAHTSLALIAENYDWDWQTAEKEYRRAIELNPNYATAHHWFAEFLAFQGRFEEALAESERARQLDPLSLIIAADRGVILYFSRRYEPAVQQFRTVLDLDPGLPRGHMIVNTWVEMGRYDEALRDIDSWKFTGDNWASAVRAYVYARAGQQQRARQLMAKLQAGSRGKEFQLPPMMAAIFAALGDKDQAIAWLERAYSEHSNVLTSLKVDPAFDPLRSDPRFQDLLRRVGLGN